MFVMNNISNSEALIRKSIFPFITCLSNSDNSYYPDIHFVEILDNIIKVTIPHGIIIETA